MGLHLGVVNGSPFFVNHQKVKVTSEDGSEVVTLSTGEVSVDLKVGYEVELFEGVIISVVDKSTNKWIRLDVNAPKTICVLREQMYHDITKATKGHLITLDVYKWLQDYGGLSTRKAIHENIGSCTQATPTKLVNDLFIFKSDNHIIYDVTRNEG